MPRPVRQYGGRREKVEHPFRLFGKTVSLVFRRYPLASVFVLIMLLVSSSVALLANYLIKDLVNTAAAVAAAQSSDFSHIYFVIGEMAALYIAGIVFSITYQIILIRISQGTLYEIRRRLFDHMESLPISYFDSHTTGEIMSVYTNDVGTLDQMITQSLPQLITSLVQVIITTVLMFLLTWELTLISLFSVAVILALTKFLGRRSGKSFVSQQQDIARLNGYIEETIKGQRVIKVFNHEPEAIDDFRTINVKLEKSNFRANAYSISMFPVVGNINYLNYAVSTMVGALLTLSGQISIGAISSFLVLNRSFGMPFLQISSQISFIFQGMAGSQRIFSLSSAPSEEDNGYVTLTNVMIMPDKTLKETERTTGHWAWKNPHHPEGQNLTLLQGDIRLFDVDFAYVPGHLVLHDVSLYAKPGQKIAFVGATGAGKTTITSLINRFYDIADGKIRYDGININKIRKADLRRSLAIVLQDTHLFTGTIEDNIRYGNPRATREQVRAAAKLARADSFIDRLPQGYDTPITGDGASLSQGQRQLISIARAAVMDPPVLILDEATSSIDTYTEHLIQDGMDRLMKGRTTFAIAHRLSTVENSDAIMVLDHGRIIERGSHKDLIAQKGVYYQLYMGAFELE